MTSLSTSLGSSVTHAIASYRRAQYLVAESTVVSGSELETANLHEDEENAAGFPDEFVDDNGEYSEGEAEPTPSASTHEFINQLQWDEDLEPTNRTPIGDYPSLPTPGERKGTVQASSLITVRQAHTQETTPLLPRKISFDSLPHPRRPSVKKYSHGVGNRDYRAVSTISGTLHRRPSNGSVTQNIKYAHAGQSTFGQTLFNSIAILLGIGMLSEPLAFSCSGWIMGTILIICYGALACYTAKILARLIFMDPRLRSYTDIGKRAFGLKFTPFINFMFCLEIFAISVVLVTLYADSLHALLPMHSANTYKLLGLIVFIPTVFLPLSFLSYTSILGIISTVMLVIVIVIDGLSKKEAPGSLWDPAPTSLNVVGVNKLGIAFGLFMAGFAGHATIPSLAKDMVDPSQFDKMINWAFVVATTIYTFIGCTGYIMYGSNVSDEISVDLLNTPGFSPLLNQVALWMLVFNPLSKFALSVQPLNTTIEILLGLDTPTSRPEDVARKQSSLAISTPWGHRSTLKKVLAIVQRLCLTCASVAVSIFIPQFSVVMAFLGSFSAFVISVVIPVAAKVKIERTCGLLDGAILFAGTTMAIWGTISAFMESDISS